MKTLKASRNQNRVTHTHTHFTAFLGKTMLAYLAVVLCFSAGVRGQNFVYATGINQYKVVDGTHYSSTDPTLDMTMDCLAANGYGQWTCSSSIGTLGSISDHPWVFSPNQEEVTSGASWNLSSSSHQKGWFLLSNLLAKPSEKYVSSSSSHPGCQPPGIVSGGEFNTTYPTTPKVVANLDGRARYVWGEPTNRLTFKVEGFNDARGSDVNDRQINITLDGLPNPPINRQIIQKPIFNYPSGGGDVTTKDAGNTDRQIDNSETDKRDEFDIAIDKKFLYIVWNSGGSIYAKAINLTDGTTATTAFLVATGTRPTVACDVRANSNTPSFVVSWINGGNIKVAEYNGNAVQHGGIETLPKTYNNPSSTSPATFNYTCNPTHARVVVSSRASVSTHVISVYVRECDELVYYDAITWNPTNDIAWYVDGIRPYQGTGTYPFPSPIPQNAFDHRNGVLAIVDNPIVAFANPYDGTSTFDEFYCLYQLAVNNNGGATAYENPLIKVQCAYNGFGNNPHSNSADTRLLLNQEHPTSGSGPDLVVDDPTSYCAAANQMGIHMHWRSVYAPVGATSAQLNHYYVRIDKDFNEDIEEHTLLTNVCLISANCKLLDGVKMTIWSDPNYGAVIGGSTSSGMYWQYPGNVSADGVFLAQDNIGTLKYTSNFDLTVGSASGSTTANLYTMPVCNIAKTGSAGSITVNSGSTWDYYGSSATPSSGWIHNWNFAGGPTINLNGPSTGPTAPNLNIHGGAIFWECPVLNADHAMVNVLFEPTIRIISPDGCADLVDHPTCPLTGLLRVSNITTLTDSKLNSFIPTVDPTIDPSHIVMLISGSGSGTVSTDITLSSTRTDYTNYESLSDFPTAAGGGFGIIQYNASGNGTASPDRVTFTDGTATGFRINATGPRLGGFTIQDMTFNKYPDQAIHITHTIFFFPVEYRDINVLRNTFQYMQSGLGYGIRGIRIENFNDEDGLGLFGELNVDGNKFNISNASCDNCNGRAAIDLVSSTGNIRENNITDHAYGTGILIETNGLVSAQPSFAYLCNNYIANMTEIGIDAQDYWGYIKLSQMTNNTTGLKSSSSSVPKIVFSSIKNSTHDGIYVSANSTVDLSGMHGSTIGSADVAAFDTIANNASEAGAQVTLAASSAFILYGNSAATFTWSNFGLNNTYSTNSNKLLLRRESGSNTIDGTDLSTKASIDRNYWGAANDPTVAGHSLWDGTNTVCQTSITYHTPTDYSGPNGCNDDGEPCWSSSGSFSTHQKVAVPMSVQASDTTCINWHSWCLYHAQNNTELKIQYDTLRHYIESCAKDDNSYQAFAAMDG
ncbi:MAG: hypothetical protein WCH46_10585, partial [bacterium]